MAHNDTHAARKKGGAGKILLVVLLLLLLAVGAAVHFAYNEIHGNGAPGSTEVTVSIPQGSGVAAIANKLKEAGVIRSAYLFRWYVGEKGAAGKLQYGDFVLQTSAISYDAIIATLSQYAKAETVRVTIPEGTTAIAIAQKMESAGLCTAEEFLKEANEGDFSAYTFWQYVPEDKDAPNRFMKCEGYLFPDTYEFFVNEDPSHAICRLLDNFSQRMDDELMTQVEESGYSLEEILIIASLIEKETDGKDRTNIASVIYNRLNNVGETYHKLEIDAAVIYGLGYANGENYAGPLTQADLDKDTPYNLRMHEGLPPTPICNPGLASIRAALEPADTNYYFYALGKDGVHHFFKTYREHVNFVNSSQYGG